MILLEINFALDWAYTLLILIISTDIAGVLLMVVHFTAAMILRLIGVIEEKIKGRQSK